MQRPVALFDPAQLRATRVASGLTQGAVAAGADLARPNYVNIETGARAPGPKVLRRIAEVLEVTTRQMCEPVPTDAMNWRELRETACLTQTELAKALGFANASSYKRIELGDVAPTTDQTRTLARMLDVPIDHLPHRRRDRSP